MSPTGAERKYIQSAVQSASPIGLTILLYDRLVADIRGAILALQNQNVEQSCEHLTHAFFVLGHLESGLDMERGGETSASLSQFYHCVRAGLIEGHAKRSPEMLQHQIELILEVRQAWQQVEQRQLSGANAEQRPAVPNAAMMFQSGHDEPQASSWTA